MSAKVLVIGLDGATFDVINPLMDDGCLPNLARLRAEGVTAPLQSTEPPSSAPAWTSCRTGVNPGKHGLFNFWQHANYEWIFMDSSDLQVPAVEHILSRYGKRVCTVNVPLTYPPQPVNGIVIAGLPTPGRESDFIYPVEVRAELKARVGEYPVDGLPDPGSESLADVFERYREHHLGRRAVAHYLLDSEPWDYFMVVFTLLDKVQHTFWREREQWLKSDPDNSPLSEDARYLGTVIDRCYKLMDETVGLLLTKAGDNATVLAISDHGFGPCRNEVYPNVWLRNEGYLRVKLGHKLWARQIRWVCRDGSLIPYPLVEIGPPRRRIAWPRTRAFGSLYVESRAIRLNLEGREPQGVVRQGREAQRMLQVLADGFLALKMPDGRPMFKHISRPEEIYDGPFTSQAADLLLEPNDPSTRVLGKFTVPEVFHPLTEARTSTGNHRSVGILYARGHKLDANTLLDQPHIMDIAPTILQALDIPVPQYMDGTPLFG